MRAAAAPLRRRLEDHRAGGNRIWSDVTSDAPVERRDQPFDSHGFLQRALSLPRDLVVRSFVQPVVALGRRDAKQFRQVDRYRSAIPLFRLDRDGGPRGDVQLETHHCFVNASDLLDIEVAVAEPLAIEHQQTKQEITPSGTRGMRAAESPALSRPSRNG